MSMVETIGGGFGPRSAGTRAAPSSSSSSSINTIPLTPYRGADRFGEFWALWPKSNRRGKAKVRRAVAQGQAGRTSRDHPCPRQSNGSNSGLAKQNGEFIPLPWSTSEANAGMVPRYPSTPNRPLRGRVMRGHEHIVKARLRGKSHWPASRFRCCPCLTCRSSSCSLEATDKPGTADLRFVIGLGVIVWGR